MMGVSGLILARSFFSQAAALLPRKVNRWDYPVVPSAAYILQGSPTALGSIHRRSGYCSAQRSGLPCGRNCSRARPSFPANTCRDPGLSLAYSRPMSLQKTVGGGYGLKLTAAAKGCRFDLIIRKERNNG